MTNQCETMIHCQDCSMSHLCLPFSLNNDELTSLDNIIQRKRPFQKGSSVYNPGDDFRSLYAVRSGSFKSFSTSSDGEQQIIAFHFPGDIMGFDALQSGKHRNSVQALETSMICEIPYHLLDEMSSVLPKLRQQIMRIMSSEINQESELLLLINKRNAEQRLAAFIIQLAERFSARGFSGSQYRLTMTRGEIGNYLGLTIETISRLLRRFQEQDLISVDGKLISIKDKDSLSAKAL